MKFILTSLFLLLSITGNFCFGQVSVTTGGPATVYTTLKAAFDAINNGTHTGVINISITGSTIETVSAVLNASGAGAAVYTSVTIKPSGGGSRTIEGNIAGALIDLNGAGNVLIDGLNTGANSLTLSNTSSAVAYTIRFINDASGNTIQNTSILAAGSAGTSSNIFFSTALLTGNNNNTVFKNTITNASSGFSVNGIYAEGTNTAGQENNGNTIRSNNISNFFNADLPSAGILLQTGNTNWTIANNRLFQSAPRTFTTAAAHRGIKIATGSGYTVSDNVIGFADAASTGTWTMNGAVATTFIALDLAVGTTTVTSVQNNRIANFLLSTTSNAGVPTGVFTAVNITSGNVNLGTVTGNIIGSTTSTGSIVVNPTVNSSYLVPINVSSTGTINISNNSIGGVENVPTGTVGGNINAIINSGALATVTISNNTIGNSLPQNIKVNTLGTTTSGAQLRGIFNTSTGSVVITGNMIRNMVNNSSGLGLFRGIEMQQGTGSISDNTISNVNTNGVSASVTTIVSAGMLITSSSTGITISRNIISGLSAINTTTSANNVDGINLGSTTNGLTVTRNLIYNLSNLSTSVSVTAPSVVSGIKTINANLSNPMLIANNMISLGNSQTTNTAFIGIWNQSATSPNYTAQIYYNSINIEGTAASGAQPSFSYYRGNFSTTANTVPNVDIKNNIFTNSRSGGTGKHYAIANGYGAAASSATGWAANASDYNVLNANSATIGYWSGDKDFTGWKTASLSDQQSLSGIVVNYNNSASDLHLQTFSNSAVDGKGTPLVLVPNDYDNDPRNAATPDIGADEFTPTVLAVSMEYFTGNKIGNTNHLTWKSMCTSASVTFYIQRSGDGRNFFSISQLVANQAACSQPFNFSDGAPLQGTNYYRLKIMDSDGKVTYSTVVAIISKMKGFEIIALMPIIVKDNAILNISSAEKAKLDIVVYSMKGELVFQQSALVQRGSNMVELNLNSLLSAAYVINVCLGNGGCSAVRFVKK